MKIYTLTLNPAYDIHAQAENFEPFHENLATVTSRDAGGKGVNISRALKNADVTNTAIVVLGRENSADFVKDLAGSGIDCLFFEKEGRIRENLTLHTSDSPETRISFAGFTLDSGILREIEKKLTVDKDTVVTFTGRVPSGISLDDVKKFLARLKSLGAKIVIDSRSFSLSDIYEVKPWLIKPNEEEIAEFLGYSIDSAEKAVKAAKEISANGIENVMISLGGKGAVLAANGKTYSAEPPKINPVSTIGAGDSSIAGFITAAAENKPYTECLKTAVAFGTAACLTEGSKPPLYSEIKEIFSKIKISEI